MKPNFTFKKFLILFVVLFFAIKGFSQTTGDYRSVADGNWTTLTSWERYNGSAWVPATTYPGQNTGTGVVTIRDTHTITITTSTPNNFGSLIIGEGASGKLIIFNDLSILTTSIVINQNAYPALSEDN